MKKNIKTLSILSLVSTMLLGSIVTTVPMTVKADKLQSEDFTYGHEEIINGQKIWAMNHDDLIHQFGLDENKNGSLYSASSLMVQSNLGPKYMNVNHLNDSDFMVDTPHVDGYRVDKNQIMVHMDHDGKVTTNESLTYTKVTSTNNQNTGNIRHFVQTITVGNNVPFVRLYSLSSNHRSINLIGDRALGPNSAWYSDQSVQVNGETYYRVATNEWAKKSEVGHPADA